MIANKYRILDKIGHGEFGTVYKGENIRTNELVAIKLEPSVLKMLKRETQIYTYLMPCEGIPQVKWYGTIENYNYLVMPLFNKSLSFQSFSLFNILSIGKQIVNLLKYIHEKGLIHRDIKPDNFLFGPNNQIYIIDFGLCKRYKDIHDNHIDLKHGKSIIGTPNFISINIHDGYEPSRRDDLESVGYILQYLLELKLEWFSELNLDKIKFLKKTAVYEEPIENYLNYCRNLYFEETPDYTHILQIIKN
jgi:serine/threonine protein kinase